MISCIPPNSFRVIASSVRDGGLARLLAYQFLAMTSSILPGSVNLQTALTSNVESPFWTSGWFWLLSLLAIAGAVIGLFKYRVYTIQSRNHQLEEAISERTAELRNKNVRLATALTKHKQAERALKDSERSLREFFENSPDAIFVLDLDGHVLDANPAACHLHKMTRDELIGKSVTELVPTEKRQEATRRNKKLAKGELTHFEGLSLAKDDEAIPIEVRARKISRLGEPALLLHVRDISERKQAEEELNALNQQLLASEKQLSAANQQLMASFEQLKENEIVLREREERIRLIIDTANDAVVSMDAAGIIQDWNKEAENTFGWKCREAIGRRLSDTIIPLRFRQQHERGLNRFLVSSSSKMLNKRLEMPALRKNGEEFPVELSISPLRVGGTYIFSAFIRDITQRKRAEAELKLAKEDAEAASRSKSDFLANMSHEIRTPLNAVIGMTELILDTDLTEEQYECLKVVQSSSDSLLSLINDILDFSKIEAGQMELEEIAFDCREVVENVTDIVRVRAEAKHIELLCYVDPSLQNWVVGDKTRLQQVLINLVGNAIKFTENGEVSIRVEPAEAQGEGVDGEVGLRFKVCDTGIGISAEQIRKIFEKFSQADTSTTRKFGGTGLGLSISKSLVEMMGGRLSVESEVGAGSSFEFSLLLPVAEAENENWIDSAVNDLSGVTVLVVDDNQTNRFILNRTLTAWGCKVREAEGAAEALAILDGGKTVLDLVILDHQMPEMDGIQLAEQIRKRGLHELKLILLSSWGEFSQKMKRNLAIAYTMTKPVKQSRLFDILKVVLFKENSDLQTVTVKGSQQAVESRQHRILLAEDNEDNQNLAKRILEKVNYEVDIAATGQAAVESASSRKYSLILMDIQMPDMDGFAATKEIRALEKLQANGRVPIVALTAHALKGYREKCLEHDMDDFMTKPLRKKTLLDTVAKWVDYRPVIIVQEGSARTRKQFPRRLLGEDQYRVVFAKRADEIVEYFKSHDISLVVMDSSPNRSECLDTTVSIRELENGRDVPIVVLTDQGEEAQSREFREVGVNECLAKPISKAQLQEVLLRFLGEPIVVDRAESSNLL